MDVRVDMKVSWLRTEHQRVIRRNFEVTATVSTSEPIDGPTMMDFLMEFERQVNHKGDIRVHLSTPDGALR